MTSNPQLMQWVESVAAHTLPDDIHWCTGTEEEYEALIEKMVATGDLKSLNQETFPNCYLHRSDPSDVARVEHLTFVCTTQRDDAGPNNHWMAPADAHEKIDALFAGCMKGRTLYVVPYCMGPIASPHARCGVEITDSPYVVANMKLMTRMGNAALKRIEDENTFVKGLHSIGDLDPERRLIMHFPEELSIKSIGSGYGGNALLGKKCHALRIGSFQARQEGWLAEHMLIVRVESPEGEEHYLACAFPSACGKTNLAMLIPPERYRDWKISTVGDDIAWMYVGEDGRLWAINPEAGYFGVVPGTNPTTNRNAYEMTTHDTIFTNVAVDTHNQPWWEGLDAGEPAYNWRGEPYKMEDGPAAHPNARFTVAARQNPSYAEQTEHPQGVPISAIVFGGRRASLAPLVYQAKSWEHGVLIGSSVASETTAAATGKTGVVRRDPMAMKPFCGYNFADYFAHWLSFEKRTDKLPKIFHVNWFRRDQNNQFLWPGFGENLRVLSWIIERCEGRVEAKETPIGFLPHENDLDTDGLNLPDGALDSLLKVNHTQWRIEFDEIAGDLQIYGDRLPKRLLELRTEIEKQLTDH